MDMCGGTYISTSVMVVPLVSQYDFILILSYNLPVDIEISYFWGCCGGSGRQLSVLSYKPPPILYCVTTPTHNFSDPKNPVRLCVNPKENIDAGKDQWIKI